MFQTTTMEGFIRVVTPRNYSFVVGPAGVVYFLHHSNIKKGMDKVAVGQPVTFGAVPPLPNEKNRKPLAINAVVGGAQ